MLLNVTQPLSIDIYMVQVIGWIVVFLTTSLIAIIVWLARTVITKVDTIAIKQDVASLELSSLKNQISTVSSDISDIYVKLNDIPRLNERTSVVHEMLTTVKDDIGLIKRDHNDFTKRLSAVEKQAAVNAEWIRMTESNRVKNGN